MDERVGFIGLGRMGMPMVANLSRGGVRVTAYDIDAGLRARAEALPGVAVAASAAAVAGEVPVLFSCLPNDRAVEMAYLEQDGVAQGAHEGLVTCDCSTISPGMAQRLGDALRARGILHMDTPMLGSQPQAESGEIFFIVSGDKPTHSRIEPLLALMGKQSMFVGASGTANKIKLIHNALGAVNAVAVAESLAMCVQGGVDVRTFYDVVCNGGGMAYSTYFDRRAARIAEGNFEPTFTLELMRKDVGMAAELARDWGVDAPIMAIARDSYEEGAARGWGREDFSAVSHLIEQRLGISLSGGRGKDEGKT